jgi:simple sugar transport system ATP-binding protein
MAADSAEIAIEAVDVWKEFGHVQALRGASIAVRRGEIVGLVGDNGAGKSTLLKFMCGALQADAGQLAIGGEPVELLGTRDARARGVEVVYQDLALAPDLSVLESIYLGQEVLAGGWRGRLGVLSRRSMGEQAEQALQRLGIRLPNASIKIQALSGGQRQAVAIARAVMWAQRVILMDEPTAALGTRQTEIVVDTIRSAAAHGIGILVISHDMPRMLKLADRIVVLRHGSVVGDLPAREATIQDIVFAMLGGSLAGSEA